MAEFVPRTTRILDLLLGVAVLLMLMYLALAIISDEGMPLLLGMSIVAVLLLWGIRRRNPQARWVGPAMLATSVVAIFGGDGPPLLPLVFFVIMLLVLDHGPWMGVLAISVQVVTGHISSLILFDQAHLTVLLDSLGGLVIFLFGFLFALMLREANLQTLAKDRALQQRDALNLALQEANQQLRDSIDLEKELLLAEERARSARELHDGLGHRLAVTRMSLEFAERMHAKNPARAMEEVGTAKEGLETAIDEMRVWVRALHPARAEQERGGFQAVADSFKSTGMDVRFTGSGEPFELTDASTLYCYRFVQEGLTNVLRHAKGDAVEIHVDYTRPGLRIQVTNTGTRPGDTAESFGLRSLRERADSLGGQFTAQPTSTGFTISAHLPRAARTTTPEPPVDTADDVLPQVLEPHTLARTP